MSIALEKCIYCPATFDPSTGEGDHIFPAALGEFANFPSFRRVCPECNQRIGRIEEELIRCSPEAYLARISDPPRRRRRDNVGWSRTKGTQAVASFLEQHGAQLKTRPVTRDPRNVEVADQLIIQDKEGNSYHIELFPGMTASAVRRKLNSLQVKDVATIQYCVAEEHLSQLTSIMEELWPNSKTTEFPATEIGVHRVTGMLRFSPTDRYARALAKMSFHYYLQYNYFGVRGDEPEFADLRSFILDGGDIDHFVRGNDETPPIVPHSFGTRRDGMVACPPHWMHILAADDSGVSIRTCLNLFLGPGYVPKAHSIVLGKRPASTLCTGAWAHALTWEPGSESKGTAAILMIDVWNRGAAESLLAK